MQIFNCPKSMIKEVASKFYKRLNLTEDQIKDINVKIFLLEYY